MHRTLVMADLFDLDAHLLQLLLSDPGVFGLASDPATGGLNADAVGTLARFAALRTDHPDTAGDLIPYLLLARADAANPGPAAALADIFGWDRNDVGALLGAATTLTLQDALAVAPVMDLAGRTGLDPALLLTLYADGLVLGADGARPLLDALRAGAPDVAADVAAAVTDMRRAILKRFAVPLIDGVTRPLGRRVTTDDELSRYLLMDVDMAVETSTSRLVQATTSVQQYIQQCRLGLEPGVRGIGISDREWGWMDGYRSWQANRQVFVHPEDYVRPELRKGKSPLFRDLERALATGPVTSDGVGTSLKRYVDQLLVVADLETVGSWFEPADRIAASLVMDATAAAAGATIDLKQTATPPTFPAVTLELWLKTSDVPPSSNLGLVRVEGYGPSDPSLTLSSAAGQLTASITDATGKAITVAAPAGTLHPERWTHVAVVVAPAPTGATATMTVLVDGRLVAPPASQPFAGFSIPSGSGVLLGQPDGPIAGVTIEVAEVRLWSVARSLDQVLACLSTTISLASPDFGDLAGYWDLGDRAIVDRTGRWEPGRISGAVTYGVPTIDQADQGRVVLDTWHFVGRTATLPYRYFHRTRSACSSTGAGAAAGEASVWSPWEEIGLTIGARFASPVVVDGRLHLFWVDGHDTPGDTTAGQEIPPVYQATITYSSRNADGTWTPARTPFGEVTVPRSLAAETAPVWLKPYVLPVAYDDRPAILVTYGATDAADATFATTCSVLQWDGTAVTGLAPSAATLAGQDYSSVTPDGTTIVAGFGASILGANSFATDVRTPWLGRYVVSMTQDHVVAYPVDALPAGATEVGDSTEDAGFFGAGAAIAVTPGERLFVGGTSAGGTIWRSTSPLYPGTWDQLRTTPLPGSQATPTALVSDGSQLYCGAAPLAPGPIAVTTAPSDAMPPAWTPMTWPSPGVGGPVTLFFDANDTDVVYGLSLGSNEVAWQAWRDGQPTDQSGTLSFPSGMPLLGFTPPVLWDGSWWIVTAHDAGSGQVARNLWTADDWRSSWGAVGPSTAAAGTSFLQPWSILMATEKGLLRCDEGPLLDRFTDDPTTGWVAITGVPQTDPTTSTVGVAYEVDLSAVLLGQVDPTAVVVPVTNQLGAYTVTTGGQTFLLRAVDAHGAPLDAQVRATVTGTVVEISGTSAPDLASATFRVERLTTDVGPALAAALALEGIDGLMSAGSQRAPELDLAGLAPGPHVAPPDGPQQVGFSAGDAYGIYFRELFFFVPWLISERLAANRRFQDARTFYEYVFKPSDAAGGGDYWRSAWLAAIAVEGDDTSEVDALEDLDPAALVVYRDDPFDAGAIADLRPMAYQRAIVTAYIRNLIAWGDDEFAAGTRESINQAAGLYRFAGDLLGARPRSVPYIPPPPATYGELADQAINELLVVLEQVASGDGRPAPAPLPPGAEPNGSVAALGFYFGLPDSPDFLFSWDLVEDRLFKIRHGLDLSGAPADLPLFEPPLALVGPERLGAGAGAATSVTVGGAVADVAAESHDKFSALLYTARAMIGGVMELGSALLRALEIGDAEALAELQIGQQAAIAERVREIRTKDVDVAASGISAARTALTAATERRDFYARLVKEGRSETEEQGIDLAISGIAFRAASAVGNAIAAPFYAVPTIFGTSMGGSSPGGTAQAIAGALGDTASALGEGSALANLIGSYERRAEEWTLQHRLAELDVQQLTHQLTLATRQLDTATLQFTVDDTSLTHARTVASYYSKRFTNPELYSWMSGRLGELHQQLYQIALGMAQMLQATLIAITGADHQLLSTGGWDDRRRGLLAGEALLVDLARIEQTYWESLETADRQSSTRQISLRQLDPGALIDLVSEGSCTFRLPQELFDRDLPGHYLRTVSALDVSLPGVEARRGELFGTLTCTSHDTVRQPDVETTRFLLGTGDHRPGAGLRRSIQSRRATLSHVASADGGADGCFTSGELGVFAGIGAVSTWRLELPTPQARAAARDLTDVVVTVTLTSRHGGDRFRDQIAEELPAPRASLLVDVARDLPDAWAEALAGLESEGHATLVVMPPAAMVPTAPPGTGLDLVSVQVVDPAARGSAPLASSIAIGAGPDATDRVEAPLRPSADGRVLTAEIGSPLPDPAASWEVELSREAGAAPPRSLWLVAEWTETARPAAAEGRS